MSEKHETVWKNCIQTIKDNVNPQSFKTWFVPIKPIKLEEKVLTIQVPSQFFYEWLEEHYVALLKKTLEKELGPGSKLEYNVIVDSSSAGSNRPYTVNMPTRNVTHNNKNEMGMPINLSNNIHNPFIIPGLKKLNVDSQIGRAHV